LWKTRTEIPSGFRRGHRGLLDRPLPPEGGGGHSETGRRTDSHRRNGFLSPAHAGVRGKAGFDDAEIGEMEVFFGNSGTEAVEGAIKLARYHTKRDKLIAFYGCFTGATLGSLSLTASKSTQRKNFGTLLGGVEHIPYPYAYRCELGHTKETCGGEIIELLEQQIFKRLFAPEEVAAIIVEPVQAKAASSRRRCFPAGTSAHLQQTRHHADPG